jgi:predicted O-methyltransferase YrrM
MLSSLHDPRVRRVLESMHAAADKNDPPLLAEAKGKQGSARTSLLDEAFIPVSPEAGCLLYTLARGAAAGTMIEFGTSFGISTIYMAAAVRDRGEGAVITTELLESKVERAREYVRDAGLIDLVDFRVGDARETLRGIDRDVSLLFLDGWKELYLPLLEQLEPALRPGALVVGDDLDLFPDALEPYLRHVRDPKNGYVSNRIPIGDAMEVSVKAR